MAEADDLKLYLRTAREALVWKLEGLPEHLARRPLTPTGTNLLGLVKHVAGVESGYLGEVFGRPFPEPLPWLAEDAEPNADMFATAEETTGDIVSLYRRVWAHSDATLTELPLDTRGEVPWWRPEQRTVTLHRIALHVIAETHRHAGHADILRETIDGATGLRADNSNLPDIDWAAHHARLEAIAATFAREKETDEVRPRAVEGHLTD